MSKRFREICIISGAVIGVGCEFFLSTKPTTMGIGFAAILGGIVADIILGLATK
jgi:hypothetical protein